MRLKGLEIMNDDPAEVDVLYAKVRAGSSALGSHILNSRCLNESGKTLNKFQVNNFNISVLSASNLDKERFELSPGNCLLKKCFPGNVKVSSWFNFDR